MYFNKKYHFGIALLFIFLSTSTMLSQKKNGVSDSFQKKIIDACPVCSKDITQFNTYVEDDFHLAHYYYLKNVIDSSFIYATKAIDKGLSPNQEYVLYTLKGLGFKHKLLYKEALQSIQTAINIATQHKIDSVHSFYEILGQLYFEQEKYLESIQYLEKWKSLKSGLKLHHSENYHNLGLAYMQLEKFAKAEENLNRSFEINQKDKDTLGLARSSLDLANLYYVQYKDDLAIPFFEKGLQFAKRANDLTVLQNAYFNLAIVEENRKDYHKSLSYRKEYEKIKDSIWNRDKIWELAKKDKEIAISLGNEKLSNEKDRRNIFIVVSSFFFLLLLLLSFSYRKIRKQHQLISVQKENLKNLNQTKDQLFSIVTHDLKTPIHTIKKRLLSVLEHVNRKQLDEQTSQLLYKSYELSDRTYLMIDNTLNWVLSSSHKLIIRKEKLALKTVVDLVMLDFSAILGEKQIELTTHIDPETVLLADLNSLKVILRNLLDNAFKFSPQKGKVTIESHKAGDLVTIEISDNGPGFKTLNNLGTLNMHSEEDTDGKKSTGIGLKLCQELAALNNGSLQFSNGPNGGASIRIIMQTKS